MRTHGALTEPSVSYRGGTPDRKGREGKGREVGHPFMSLQGGSDRLAADSFPGMNAMTTC